MEDKELLKIKQISGLFDLTTVIFLTLRACDVINWKWWQVLMPEFIGIFLLVTLIIGFIIGKAMKSVDEDY